jgi:MFS family permease
MHRLTFRKPEPRVTRMHGPDAGTSRFLGWRMVFAGFVAQFVYSSMSVSAFGVFVTPLEREFDTSRASLSAAFGLSLLAMGIFSPLLGRWIDRGSLRWIMLAGLLLASGGTCLLSQATALWQLGVVYCTLVAFGTALYGPLPSMALVANWFVRRRGIALGLTVAGATFGGALAPVVAALCIDHFGWRNALLAFGLGSLALAAPVFAFGVVSRPAEVGQRPDGEPAPAPESSVSQVARRSHAYASSELLRDRNFLVLAFGTALIFTSPIVATLHLVPFAEGLGFSRQDAAFVFTPVAAFSLLGKLAFGAVSDRIDPRHALRLAVLILAAGWLLMMTGPTYPQLLLAGALLGLGIGAVMPLHGVLIGLCFRAEAFGQVMGLGGLLSLPIVAGANPVAGWLYDATGSYQVGFGLEVGCLLGAGLCFSALRVGAPAGIARAAASALR